MQGYRSEVEYDSSSLVLKRKEMHHTAEIATRMYNALLIMLAAPPKSHAIISSSKIPTNPQFIPPIIRRISANLSHILRTPLYSGFDLTFVYFATNVLMILLLIKLKIYGRFMENNGNIIFL